MNVKLAAANLIISQLIILIILIFAYFVWFPHSLSGFINFSKNVQLIIIINLVMGPILLMYIFKKNKKIIKFDLLILNTLQILAIGYGAYMIYQKHPSYAVFTIDRFTLVNSANSQPNKIRFKELETSIFSKTKLVFAKLPENNNERNELMLSAMTNPESDLDKRHEYFEPYANHIDFVIKKSIDTNKLFYSEESKVKLNIFLKEYDGAIDDYIYLPLQSATKDVVWVLEKKTAQPVGIINIDPWI